VVSQGQALERLWTEAFIRDHFQAKAVCDTEELAAQLSEDVVWWPAQSAQKSGFLERPIVGSAAMVRDITSEKRYQIGGRRWQVDQVVVDGNRVAVRARLRARIAPTGELYENSYAYFMRLNSGCICEVWEELDTADAFAAFEAFAAPVSTFVNDLPIRPRTAAEPRDGN